MPSYQAFGVDCQSTYFEKYVPEDTSGIQFRGLTVDQLLETVRSNQLIGDNHSKVVVVGSEMAL